MYNITFKSAFNCPAYSRWHCCWQEGFEAEIYTELADDLSDQLTQLPALHGEVVIDDRTQLSIGHRVYDALQIGYPYIVILGKKVINKQTLSELHSSLS